jgi:outer membrane immunogenic protein
MLRKILMTTVAATAMAGSAFAADLPSRRAPPVAYVPPIPIFTWTGFYIGVNGGGAFRANSNNAYSNAVFFGGAAPVLGFNNNANNGRFLVGGQAGVNYQIGQFVLGIEGDGDAVLGNNRNSFPGASGGSSTGFLGTVRGRGGIAFDRFLVYGTGGVAFGSTNLPTTAVATVAGIPGFFTTANGNNTRVGYAVGAGVEYAFLNNWSVKVEYLFTDLGRNNRSYLLGTGPGFTVTGREQNHIVRAGLNYKFDWFGAAPGPVVARY